MLREGLAWGKQTQLSVFTLITPLLVKQWLQGTQAAAFNSAFFPPQCSIEPARDTQKKV